MASISGAAVATAFRSVIVNAASTCIGLLRENESAADPSGDAVHGGAQREDDDCPDGVGGVAQRFARRRCRGRQLAVLRDGRPEHDETALLGFGEESVESV